MTGLGRRHRERRWWERKALQWSGCFEERAQSAVYEERFNRNFCETIAVSGSQCLRHPDGSGRGGARDAVTFPKDFAGSLRSFGRQPYCDRQCMAYTPPERDGRTFAIIGAAMEVHRVLGPGFLESFFREALQLEFGLRRIPFKVEVPCSIDYKGHRLGGTHHIDFVCFDAVVVEIKARSTVGAAEHAQVLNYLASTKCPVGLLLNFGAPRLEYRRFVRSEPA